MTIAKSNIVLSIICILIGILLSAWFRRCSRNELPEDSEPIVLTDTINIHDTMYIAKHTKPIEIIRHDTLWLPKVDSVENAHTTTDIDYALIPITQNEYRDTFATDSTKAEIAVLFSGYNAKIDSIGLTYESTIQPKVYVKKKGWAWCVMPSVQVGYGVAFGNQVITAPYVGVGVSVGFGYTWRK